MRLKECSFDARSAPPQGPHQLDAVPRRIDLFVIPDGRLRLGSLVSSGQRRRSLPWIILLLILRVFVRTAKVAQEVPSADACLAPASDTRRASACFDPAYFRAEPPKPAHSIATPVIRKHMIVRDAELRPAAKSGSCAGAGSIPSRGRHRARTKMALPPGAQSYARVGSEVRPRPDFPRTGSD